MKIKNIAYFVVFLAAQLLYGLEDKSDDKNDQSIISSLEKLSVDDYDLEKEYQIHQKTHERFFRRLSRKPNIREIIKKFEKNIADKKDLERINLDGLSSRSRILLFRELTTNALAQNISLPFIFHNKEFDISLKATLRQPGDGIISTIGKYKDIFDILNIYSLDYQKEISKKLKKARQAKPYHPPIPFPILTKEDKTFDLEILNILLDFEIARRLQGTQEQEKNSYFAKEIRYWGGYLDDLADCYRKEGIAYGDQQTIDKAVRITDAFFSPYGRSFEKFLSNIKKNQETNLKKETQGDKKIAYIQMDKDNYDSIPIASAIVGVLKLSSNSPSLASFVHAPHIRKINNSDFPYGDFNAFQGLSQHRKEATEKIIELKAAKKTKNSSLEEIHQEYLEIFGGDSESEAEEYTENERFGEESDEEEE